MFNSYGLQIQHMAVNARFNQSDAVLSAYLSLIFDQKLLEHKQKKIMVEMNH